MTEIDLHSYDKYIVSYSGGKDSTACFLYLLENGIPPEKIELWHQDIDGRSTTFFDWEVTPDYCRQFAKAFGVKIFFQWKIGGFEREMLRDNSLTAPTSFELPDGSVRTKGGTGGDPNTRRKFPQVCADLKKRWCSAYLKIDVFTMAIVNQERFRNIRTLVISGERGEESPQRAKYKIFEPDRADRRDGKKVVRHVDRFRPIRDWKEHQVWDIIRRFRVRPHPCYFMGFSRCSCKFCIFGNKDQMASANLISPGITRKIVGYESDFKCTIKRNTDLATFISTGKPYGSITQELISQVTSYEYKQSIIIPPSEEWILPAGAFGVSCGPS